MIAPPPAPPRSKKKKEIIIKKKKQISTRPNFLYIGLNVSPALYSIYQGYK